MSDRPEDICPRDEPLDISTTGKSANRPATAKPATLPIYTTSVWQCESTDHAEKLLKGETAGFVYQRDGHPNSQLLAEKCRRLHQTDWAVIPSSGMAAMSAALLSQLQQGDHIIVSSDLYGRSLLLLVEETARLGIESTVVDTCDVEATAAAFLPNTKLLVAETISNPTLRVADIAALSEMAHNGSAILLMDNTFATPVLCRPATLGADLVLESISKLMNGHSDVILGMLAGSGSLRQRVSLVLSAWGLSSSPMDCYLASRGLTTMPLRVERASENALCVANFLSAHEKVQRVDYPGLANHPQHELAKRQFNGRYGSIVTFHLAGGRPAADAFITSAKRIAFCPSLGEPATTLSHPTSTSHRLMGQKELQAMGIDGGTIRLSLGLESSQFVLDALAEGLAGVGVA